MGLLDVFRRKPEPVERAISYNDAFLRGIDLDLLPGRINNPMQQVATVYVAIDRISEAVSKIPCLVKKGETNVEKHPLQALVQRGNEVLKGGQLLYGTSASLLITGECFWLVTDATTDLSLGRGAGPFPKRVLMPPPSTMEEVMEGDRLVAWKLSVPSGVRRIELDECVYFRLYNPHHQVRGLAPLTAARLEYELEWKAGKWNEKFFSNGARPPFYVYSPPGIPTLTPSQREQMSEQLDVEAQGLHNAHRPFIGHHGRELRPIALSQKDMDFIAGRKLSREQILAVFGVPPAVAGVFEYANYANSAEQKRYFWAHTLRPLAGLIQDTIQADLMEKFARGYDCLMDIDSAMEKDIPEDYTMRIDTAQKLWAMGVPFSEINERMRLGFETDAHDWMDTGFLPSSVQPAEFAMEPPPAPVLPPGAGDPNSGEDPEDGEDEKPSKRHKGHRNGMSWHMFKPRLHGYELAMARRMQAVYHQAQKYTIDRVKELAPVVKATGDGGGLLPPSFRYDVKQAAAPIIKRAVIEGGTSVIVEIGREAEFDWADPIVQGHVARRQVMVEQTTETFQRRLEETVTKGISDGASDSELKVAIEELYDAQGLHLRSISRTETAAAFNSGRFEAMQQAGVQRHEWLTAGDERVRESHMALDGCVAVVGTNDWEGPSGVVPTQLHYPLDPTAPASEVCNCRCVTIPVED
jgi:HK97 family phage portal protein